MKIAIAQLNYHIGNFERNVSKILKAVELGKQRGADLVVFSELSVCGYMPQDQLDYPAFVKQCTEAIKSIAKQCRSIGAIVGGPSPNKNRKGKNLYNTAYFLHNGKVESLHHKATLPDYDIFDEYRYFEPSREFKLLRYKGYRIALPVCEDVWNEHTYPLRERGKDVRMYSVCPMDEWKKLKPDIILNISASPFAYDHAEERMKNLKKISKKYKLPLFYVNQVGANTELVFDGGSIVLGSGGKLCDVLNYFEEDFRIYDLSNRKKPKQVYISAVPKNQGKKIQRIHTALVSGVQDFFEKHGFTKAILGLSGGIDSAVVMTVAVAALGKENVNALLLPSPYSSDHSLTDAVQLCNNLGCGYEKIPIGEAIESFRNTLAPSFTGKSEDVTEENIQARIRVVVLMALANKSGYVLLNTSNKSESATGYGTLYGDLSGSLSVLGDVYKTEVYDLARFINSNKEIIPQNILEKAPSAELKPGQTDQDTLPEYPVLDAILFQYIESRLSPQEIIRKGFDPDTVMKTIQMVNRSEFKRRQSPPALRVSRKAFNPGRKMPLTSRFF